MPPRTLPVRLARALCASAVLILTAACQTHGPATVERECRLFRPLGSSLRDTPDTRRGIVEHNRVGTAACGWRR